MRADGTVEIDKRGIPICFGVVEDALHSCIFELRIYRYFGSRLVFVDRGRYDCGLPRCQCKFDRLRSVFKFGPEDGGFADFAGSECGFN